MNEFIDHLNGVNLDDSNLYNIIDFLKNGLMSTFYSLDHKLYQFLGESSLNKGSTALIVIFYREYLITANLGDSRAVMGNVSDFTVLTDDFTPVF